MGTGAGEPGGPRQGREHRRRCGGGAEAINQYLAAELVEEIELQVVPILLGGGARLFADVDPGLRLEQRRAVDAPGVAHLSFRVVK